MLAPRQVETDEELIAAAQDGDRDALGMLFERHQERIRRFIQRKVDSIADVDDLIQNVFLEMVRGLPAYEGRSQFSTWVLGISLNLVRNHYSRSPAFRHHFVSEGEVQSIAVPNSDGPEAQTICDQNFNAMGDAISNLPRSLREPLLLVVYQGLSYEEAAECLDISLSSLKSRIFRARKLLRQALEN